MQINALGRIGLSEQKTKDEHGIPVWAECKIKGCYEIVEDNKGFIPYLNAPDENIIRICKSCSVRLYHSIGEPKARVQDGTDWISVGIFTVYLFALVNLGIVQLSL